MKTIEIRVTGGVGRVWESRPGKWSWSHPNGSEGCDKPSCESAIVAVETVTQRPMKPTNETKWTPGPWRIVDTKSHCDFTIVPQWQRGTIKRDWDGDYYPIASVSRSFLRTVKDGKKRKLEHPELPAGQALANARLIASAPKLFAALQAMLAEVMLQPSCIRESKTAFAPVIEQARAALDKAREGK